MNIYTNLSLSFLIVASSHAVEIHNRSALPALIDKVILSVNTGLDEQPSIKEKNITIAPGKHINHQGITGQVNAIVRQIALQHNNMIYLFAVSPEHQNGSILIHTDGRMSSSNGIHLTEKRSIVAPTRDRPAGPQMI